MGEIYLSSIIGYMAAILVGLWLVSIVIKDVSFVDSFWPMGFVIVAGLTLTTLETFTTFHWLYFAMVAAWGLRLGLHLFVRWRKEGADKRYVKILSAKSGLSLHIFSLWFVFLLQGTLILIIGMPVVHFLSQATPDPAPMQLYLSIALFAIGLFFEAVGDHQLKRFKASADNEGKVLDRGLWAYTRHPNYFGDSCVWWGLWVMDGSLLTLPAPIIMTYLLMKWSGVPLLERGLKQSRPRYEDYMKKTSPFIPMPPRK